MKIHFRFFLSHDNSKKYQYFMKSMYFEKTPRQNRLEASCFTRRDNAPYDISGNDARN